jgi:uncharacterized protein (TIGR03118 family)
MHIRVAKAWALAVALTLGIAPAARAQFYSQHNLVSDGAVTADHVDADLVNAWGLVSSATSPWWVSDNGTGVSTVYNAAGVKITAISPTGHVTIPGGAPTGVVFNPTAGRFLTNPSVPTSAAHFIFDSEAGIISAWSAGPVAVARVTNPDAVYKGLAIATQASNSFLYATNFHAGRVEVYDSNFAPVVVPGAFSDPTLPAGYAPFGIQNIGGVIYVTYALQDAAAHDDVPGEGHGYVNAFDTAGTLLGRVASQGPLNSPWGLAMAPVGPPDFGKFSGDLLVGNFGDGRIHAYDPNDGFELRGPLHSTHGRPIEIDGLWALQFGHGAPNNGPTNALFFTAGPFEEGHGLFGRLDVADSPGHER